MGQARTKYTREYKDEAVELVVSSGLFRPVGDCDDGGQRGCGCPHTYAYGYWLCSLGLRVRGVLPAQAVSAIGGALAWLHHPVLAGLVLAPLAVFGAWLSGVHGVITPLPGVLRHPLPAGVACPRAR